MLKIELDALPVLALGDVRALQVGDAVLAIGNPFNVGQTVTAGIVSALERKQDGSSPFQNFIQTDAAINPGNSGGALVNADGQLVGINTAIYSRTGGSMGIGFAVPVDTARQVMEILVRGGSVRRGWIGVETRDLSAELVEALKLPVSTGVLIAGVQQGGPAARGGVRPGDVVVRVGDTAVAVNPDDERYTGLIGKMLVLPLAIVAMTLVWRYIRRYSRRAQERMGDIASILEESIGGVRVVKAFGREDHEKGRFAEANKGYYKAMVKMARARLASSPINEFLGTVAGVIKPRLL